MNDYVEKYNARGYVKQIKRGHQLFWLGFPLMIGIAIVFKGSPFSEVFFAAGGLWAFIAGITHFFDSRSRILKLRNRLEK